ncbi:ABC transporter substrate-binding protein [Rhodospirillum rubrum]|uniref:DUF2076 domain-containing protein n=1 Tax=Rhodospirillum rubrum TaxID=1085 RepID=UPI00190376A5|nr:DUF2076 domain-containing protein [Rhodospirillum rubrum]MBK1663914.1 ABC transporter substrate-binding protein [Rhodospirillum rubrum]MBK1676077.1 ABC transporter substrate-binding protein [Rhodospirillum rubrum]
MNQTERDMIEGLFGKLRTVESQAPQRDSDAERFIAQRIAASPNAAYYMAQTILVQEQALKAANERLTEMERERETRPAASGGFLSGLFGGNSQPQPPRRATPMGASYGGRSPHPGAAFANAPQGGFLAGAMQTAMGVAGGVLMGNAIMSLFSGDEAQAAEPAPEPAPEEDYATDDADFDDGGFEEL